VGAPATLAPETLKIDTLEHEPRSGSRLVTCSAFGDFGQDDLVVLGDGTVGKPAGLLCGPYRGVTVPKLSDPSPEFGDGVFGGENSRPVLICQSGPIDVVEAERRPSSPDCLLGAVHRFFGCHAVSDWDGSSGVAVKVPKE